MSDPLTDIAADLYTGSLDDFVSARNERAAAADDRELATRIRALRKPSVAAWVVNVFARERAAQLGEALQLAQELREAQDDLDARALSQLGRDRRALTRRLAATAVELAEARGERVTASTQDAVQQTITAAFFDPDAAAAVASGRLIRELEPSGTFADIVDTLVGGGAPAPPDLPDAPVDEVTARRERRQRERALRDAEQVLHRAEREAAATDRALRDASLKVDELARRERELEKELESVRRDADRARVDAAEAGGRQAELAQRVADAEDAVQEAQRALEGDQRS